MSAKQKASRLKGEVITTLASSVSCGLIMNGGVRRVSAVGTAIHVISLLRQNAKKKNVTCAVTGTAVTVTAGSVACSVEGVEPR